MSERQGTEGTRERNDRTPATPRQAATRDLEDQEGPLKRHGDALLDRSGNRHGERERDQT